MRYYKIFISVFLLLTLNTEAQYQPPIHTHTKRAESLKATEPIVSKLIATLANQYHFPGYAFGIVLDGQLIYSGAGGYANIEKQIKADTRSMFRIASMSKSFTAMAILKLRDEGKLKLDDPVHLYIPELKGQALTKDAADITIRDILTHSAGFPEDNPWGDRQLADTDEDLINFIKKGISFSNVNGTTYEYSNLGFAMQGYIIKKITGIPYSEYIERNIWKRLGMQASWEYSKVPEQQYAKGYRWVNDNWQAEIPLHDGVWGAMGGMITSIESFTKYLNLHQQAWPARNDDENNIVLKRSSLREMHQAWRFNSLNPNYTYSDGRNCATSTAYGYGLAVLRDCDNKLMVGHSGGLPGFGSNWRILPEYGLGIMLFANVTYAPAAAINMRIIDTLLKLTNLKSYTLPPSTILTQRRNELVKLLPNFTNAEKYGIFAENFFPDYPINDLRKEAIAIFNKVGKILAVEELVPENQLRGSFIILCEKGKVAVSFTLTPENPALIQEYHIREIK